MPADADLLPMTLLLVQAWVQRLSLDGLALQLTALERRFPAWPVVGAARQDPPLPREATREARMRWQGWEQRLVLAGLGARLGRG